jgi:uncharacterized protein with PQ loop repeat
MNLLSIEMLLLTLGVSMLVWVFYSILLNIAFFAFRLKKDNRVKLNMLPQAIVTVIGIMLIIISKNI